MVNTRLSWVNRRGCARTGVACLSRQSSCGAACSFWRSTSGGSGMGVCGTASLAARNRRAPAAAYRYWAQVVSEIAATGDCSLPRSGQEGERQGSHHGKDRGCPRVARVWVAGHEGERLGLRKDSGAVWYLLDTLGDLGVGPSWPSSRHAGRWLGGGAQSGARGEPP